MAPWHRGRGKGISSLAPLNPNPIMPHRVRHSAHFRMCVGVLWDSSYAWESRLFCSETPGMSKSRDGMLLPLNSVVDDWLVKMGSLTTRGSFPGTSRGLILLRQRLGRAGVHLQGSRTLLDGVGPSWLEIWW